jgi:hypothetical protein
MFNEHEHVLPEPITIRGAILVQKYVYSGNVCPSRHIFVEIHLGRNYFEDEVNRRIQLGWALGSN